METNVVSIHWNGLGEAIPINTHIMCFHSEMEKKSFCLEKMSYLELITKKSKKNITKMPYTNVFFNVFKFNT